MEINTFIGSVDNLKEGAQIALTNRLFVNGWHLRTCLKRVFTNSRVRLFPRKMPSLIFIAEENGKPISCSLVIGNHFMVFVRKEYRRRGIASEMYHKSMELLKRDRSFWMKVDDSRQRKFYAKVKARRV